MHSAKRAVPHDSDAPPTKRWRTLLACQSCRTRKLSCDGGRPCGRCRQDGRECTSVESADRTPLTRKRMTELEQKLEQYERVWQVLHPAMPISAVHTRIAQVGFEAAIKELQQEIAGPTAQRPEADGDNIESRQARYPSTRPVSPGELQLGVTLDMHSEPYGHTDEWNEEPSDEPDASPSTADASPKNDFGTGVRGAAGYTGMSSAATMLRAIQKLAPASLPPLISRLGEQSTPSELKSVRSKSAIKSPAAHTSTPTMSLPPWKDINSPVDNYFQYFHALHPIVHQPTIRAQLTGALPLPHNSTTYVLLYMIFATGAFDSATSESTGDDGHRYYETARAHLRQDLFEEGSLVLVQGLAIMAIYLQRRNKPNSGYVCLGLAIRMATALGMHVSAQVYQGSEARLLDLEMKSRVWWCLVALETGMSLTYGRPHAIASSSLSAARLPLNIDDEHLTVSSTAVPAEAPHVTQHTALVVQAKLAQVLLYSMDRIGRSLPSPTVDQVKWSGDHFRDQWNTLPAYARSSAPFPYRLSLAIQTWRARDFRSVLYRPVFLSAAWRSGGTLQNDRYVREIIDNCRTLASENLQEIAEFVRSNDDPHRGAEWYTLYFAIQASLSLMLSILWEPQHSSAQTWRYQISETITWFRSIRSMRQLALSHASIMEKVLQINDGASLNGQTLMAPNDPTLAGQSLPHIDQYDFEQYLSEIWDGHNYQPGMADDFSLGFEANAWDAMINDFGTFPDGLNGA